MKQTDTKSLEELMETLLRMKKYDWAYSKIKSVNDREQYNLNLNEAERKSEYIQLAPVSYTHLNTHGVRTTIYYQ